MKKFNVITEVKNKIKANEMKIHLYKLSVRDMSKKHSENGAVAWKLSSINNSIATAFYGQIIGAFQEIKEWGEYSYIEKEHRVINPESCAERALLERLLLREVLLSVDTSKYKAYNNCVYIKNPVYNNHDIKIERYFKFDIKVEETGDIIIGYDVRHTFDYIHTLDKDIKDGTVKEGDKVKDYFYNSSYEYIGVAPFTIAEKNDYLGTSIKEYYINKNKENIVKNLPDSMNAVLVKKGNDIFPYIPSRLKKYCRFESLPSIVLRDFKNKVQQKTNEKMTFTVKEVLNILSRTQYIEACTKNMIAEEIGYSIIDLKRPQLVFGNDKTGYFPSKELINPSIGTFEKKTINVKYFIDPNIANDSSKLKMVNSFCIELEKFSGAIGVQLNRQQVGGNVKFREININNEDNFTYDLKKVISSFDNTTIVILEDENLNKYYNTIKKTFGYQNNIATQCISLKTLSCDSKGKKSLFLNILLGLYAKNNVQPWILRKRLNSDCFIGLDVSRENKVNKAGVVQVIGYDGRVLKTKVISSSQSGEKIKAETLKEIVFEAVASYESVYGRKPNHITFHRDGVSREELESLKITTENLGIAFDYIEVTKGINRRIATLYPDGKDSKEKTWETEMGKCYTKDNYAFICTTKPYEGMGMAQPIRIKQVEGKLNMIQVVEDVYNLSFMHIGATNKTRLPITTYYADLSSTYGNRELIPVNMDSSCLHFI